MKTVICAFAFAGLLGLTACSPTGGANAPRKPGPHSGDPLLIRVHFIGTEQLFTDTNAAKIRDVWNLRSSADLRREALNRIARLPSQFLGGAVPQGAGDQFPLLRPLLDDLLARECYIETRATPELSIAVKLPDNRAQVWQSNLLQAVKNWKLGTPANLDGNSGWELKRDSAPQRVRVTRLRDWVVVNVGPAGAAAESNMLAAIRAEGRPGKATGAWLEGDANLARLNGLPLLGNYENVPMAHFALSNRAEFVRSLVTLDFGKPHGWKPEDWRVPTNNIFDPLAVFTAVRGIAPLLDGLKPVQELGYKPTPNQIVGWGNQGLPFQMFYTTPSRDVTNQLKRVQPKLNEMLFPKGVSNFVGSTVWDTNRGVLFWRGLPLATPQFGAMRDGGVEFLDLKLFPVARTRQRAPAELLGQIHGRPNLVYYDWEITEYRIPHWRQFYQLAELATGRALSPSNSPSQRWTIGVAPLLGESVTEVTATSPTQMTLVRKSHLGLTAFELVTMSRWIESTNFPAFGVFPAQPPPLARRPRPGQPRTR